MLHQPLIVVVGVCASGKTTLFNGLNSLGYNVRNFAQEHSVTSFTWQHLKPDFLIVLDCEFETIKKRKIISWGLKRYREQQDLLENAREHADLIVKTDELEPQELIDYVHQKLKERGVTP